MCSLGYDVDVINADKIISTDSQQNIDDALSMLVRSATNKAQTAEAFPAAGLTVREVAQALDAVFLMDGKPPSPFLAISDLAVSCLKQQLLSYREELLLQTYCLAQSALSFSIVLLPRICFILIAVLFSGVG